jgi:hypothetical protein
VAEAREIEAADPVPEFEPQIFDYGDLVELTQAQSQSGTLDGNYPPGYPSDPGLFS